MNNPENFFDFSKGVDISEEEINGRIIEIIYKLRADCTKPTQYSIASGNCKVEIFYDPVEERAEICVSKNFKEATIFFREGGIVDMGRIPIKKDPTSKKWRLSHKLEWDDLER